MTADRNMQVNNPYAPPSQPIESELELIARARRELGRPATAIIVMSSIHSVFDSIPLVNYAVMTLQGASLYTDSRPIGTSAVFFCIHVFQSVCGAKMVLESRRMGFVGAVLVCIPLLSPFVLLGIPFGIWALVLLQQKHIIAAFALSRNEQHK